MTPPKEKTVVVKLFGSTAPENALLNHIMMTCCPCHPSYIIPINDTLCGIVRTEMNGRTYAVELFHIEDGEIYQVQSVGKNNYRR